MTIKDWYKKQCTELRNDPLGSMDWYGAPDWWMFTLNTLADIAVFGSIAYVVMKLITGLGIPALNYAVLAIVCLFMGHVLCNIIDVVRDSIVAHLEAKRQRLLQRTQEIAPPTTEELTALCATAINTYNALGNFLADPNEVAMRVVQDWKLQQESTKVE